MLVIRFQRTGRRNHAQFRVVVQDARQTPTSGKVVAQLGSYDPHTKTANFDKQKASFYLEHGAQPSTRAARLLKAEGVKLPKWVEAEVKKAGKLRKPEKLRRNRPAEVKPAEPVAEEAAKEPVDTEPVEAEAAVVEAKAAEPTEAEGQTADEPVERPEDEKA